MNEVIRETIDYTRLGVYNLRRLLYLLTVPGVVMHEYSHKTTCDSYNIPVKEVVYFRFDDPPGYVVHVEPRKYIPKFMIAVAPFVLNSFIAVVLVSATALVSDVRVHLISYWLAFSMTFHSFPSKEDARSLIPDNFRGWLHPLVLVGLPVVILIYAANFLRRFFFDVFYSVLLISAVLYLVRPAALPF